MGKFSPVISYKNTKQPYIEYDTKNYLLLKILKEFKNRFDMLEDILYNKNNI